MASVRAINKIDTPMVRGVIDINIDVEAITRIVDNDINISML